MIELDTSSASYEAGLTPEERYRQETEEFVAIQDGAHKPELGQTPDAGINRGYGDFVVLTPSGEES